MLLYLAVPLPNLPDVSAIHSTTFTTMHIDETVSTTCSARRSSTDTLASITADERRSFVSSYTNGKAVVSADMQDTCNALAARKVHHIVYRFTIVSLLVLVNCIIVLSWTWAYNISHPILICCVTTYYRILCVRILFYSINH